MAKASVYFTLDNLDGKHGGKAIKRELDALPGVLSVSINPSAHRVAVDFDTTGVQPDRIRKQLETMGYQILNSEMDDHMM